MHLILYIQRKLIASQRAHSVIVMQILEKMMKQKYETTYMINYPLFGQAAVLLKDLRKLGIVLYYRYMYYIITCCTLIRCEKCLSGHTFSQVLNFCLFLKKEIVSN